MVWLYFLTLGPVIAGITGAAVWWLFRGRKKILPAGSVGDFSLTAGLVTLLGGVAVQLVTGPLSFHLSMPSEFWEWYRDYRFTIPLLFGIIGVIILSFPVQRRGGQGSAELTPRTPLSFASRSWLIAPAMVLALVLAVTLTAGAASQPDKTTGLYTMYFVELGGERSAGSTIYGWYYSIPCLVLLAVMFAIVAFNLFLIARPPLDHNRDRDVRTRTIRTRNVLMLGTGALLWHLGFILTSLAGTASLRGSFDTSEGNVGFWTTFAALEPALTIASYVTVALGFALWSTVTLSAIPSQQREPATVQS